MFTDKDFEGLSHFVGYGNLDADYWFIGMEEGGGGKENLEARKQFSQVMDCAEAHEILGITKYHKGKNIIQRTWRGMCCIMLALEGKEINTESIREYQANNLGRSKGNTLLCELMPIPKPRLDAWEYFSLFPQFSSREDYYRKIKPRRIKYLRSILAENKPNFVIYYGKKYWDDFKLLFPNLHFLKTDQFEIARSINCQVLLSDHFTARTMNGKFNIIAQILKTNSTV